MQERSINASTKNQELCRTTTCLAQSVVERDANQTLAVAGLHCHHPFRRVLAENTAPLTLGDAHLLHGRANTRAGLLNLKHPTSS
jgi:hypothetical protein